MKKVRFMDIDFVDFGMNELMSQVFDFLSSPNEQKYIVTPNPEMVVESVKNPFFLGVLQNAWICLPDGFGITFYSKFLTGEKIVNRITGVDFVTSFLEQNKSHKVFLVGGAYGAAKLIKQKYADTVVDFYDSEVFSKNDEYLLQRIENSGATVLLVALGAPKQEIWIAKNLEALPNIKLAVGIGGSLDFLAGVQKRAPIALRSLGLEWLWRLILQPKRIGRIFRATVVFSWLVLRRKLGV